MKKIYTLLFILFGTLLSTAQTGSWALLTSGTSTSLLGVSAPDANTIYASGLGGIILKSSNSGATWSPQTSGTGEDLYEIAFTSTTNGVAVGNNGAVRHTTRSEERRVGKECRL